MHRWAKELQIFNNIQQYQFKIYKSQINEMINGGNILMLKAFPLDIIAAHFTYLIL
uniref:Uncharacterized protein n=1 Tax=Tetranychus urticae TaxID=32264 RepID=T1JUQ7_TETUR